ncbi:hypothetical protein AB0D67_20665 [Streptosporangium sp. NPDC048047]|uniref:hypothetical protein n=1 Tax=Streptosporangium sp. NPDC048047 TaxID=3155748 RepID=UPI00342BB8AE
MSMEIISQVRARSGRSGNEPELEDPFGRYVITTFVKGTDIGPYEAARHIPGVRGHELSYTANRHFSIVPLREEDPTAAGFGRVA